MYVMMKLLLGSEEYVYVKFCKTEDEVPALYKKVNDKLTAASSDEHEILGELAKDANDPHKSFADLQKDGIIGKNAKQVSLDELCKLSWK